MAELPVDGVRRFDSRVDHYAKYRPDYPHEIVSHLKDVAGLLSPARVVDVGSGTGKLAQVFLEAGDVVFGVEPNATMRAAARRALSQQSRFQCVAARAEELALCDSSFDLVVAGQAFHWFDTVRARDEFARVLKPGGLVALAWNNRKQVTTGFLPEYEDMLQRLCPDYARVGNKHYDEAELERFFDAPPNHTIFAHAQELDRPGLHGRLLSSSYVPATGSAWDLVRNEADALFERHSINARITIAYDSVLFWGNLR